jgi:uncharacterized protein (TIGR03437 family)
MDAAQKLLKNIAILTAATLLLSTVGLAAVTLVATPATVAIGATGYNTAAVTSSDGTTIINYSIGTPTYSGGDPAWLAVSGVSTTPSTLTFNAHNVAGLSSALHTATVTLTPSGAIAALTVTVTYDTSGGGGSGGGSTLTASKTSVSLDSIHTSDTVNIGSISATAVSTSVTWAQQSGTTSWLSASQVNPFVVNPGATSILTIFGDPTGLAAGTYQGTVTVTPDTGSPLTISVTLTVGGSGGGWTALPTSIQWSFTTGGTFPSQAVSVTTTSAGSSYNINTTQNSGYHWLLVASGGVANTFKTGIPVGAGFTLSVGSAANNLLQGTYTDQAILTDANSTEQLRITVNLTVNGGTSAGLTINPTSVSLAAAVNGTQQSQVVSVTSTTGGTLTVTGCTLLSWLTCTLPSNATVQANVAVAFTVYANPGGFAASTQTGVLQIQVGSQSGTLNVSLVIGGGGGGGGTSTTAVAPAALTFAYEYGTNTTFVARQKLVITGPAGAWSATTTVFSPTGGAWLKLSPLSGTSLPDPSIDGAAPIVSIDPTGLAVGTYNGSLTVTTSGGTQVILVTLTVVSSTIILPNPAGTLIFTAQSGQPKPSPQGLFWSDSDNGLSLGSAPVTAATTTPWITLGGAAQGTVTVYADQTGLTSGLYSGSITLTQAGAGNSPETVPVLMVVNGGTEGGGTGTLTFSPTTLSFTATNGVLTPSSTILSVGAPAQTSFVASISYTSGSGSWLKLTPLSGVTAVNLSATADPTGLANGTYTATVAFSALNVVQTLNASLTVNNSGGGTTGNVTVSPTALTFTASQGSSPAAQTVSVASAAGAAGVPFTTRVTAGATWLSTSASASNTTPATLTISVNSTALSANTYSGNILITPSGGLAVNIPVTLTVTAPAGISAAPTQMTFSYRLGDAAPAAQQLTVSGSGATFTATATSSGNWLVVTPTTGTAPTTVNVSINKDSITTTGALNGTVLVAATGGASGSTTVNVTLNVTSLLPTLSRVTNAASYATNAISPGEIITLFADDPTHPIGPATPARLTLDANGNVATTIGAVQVTVAGYNCPMIYASASQVSAVVPYEVKIYSSASVLVKYLGQGSNGILMNVVTTAPGLFTTNASGTGPGAILNSDLSVNTAANPAARGDIVVIYMTGEGETSPGGVTGKVTTVASPPAPLTPGPLLQPSVTIGGQPASWTFAGEAPGFVSGVMQLNVVVPTNIAAGDQPIVVTLGGVPSQQGVTVSVK